MEIQAMRAFQVVEFGTPLVFRGLAVEGAGRGGRRRELWPLPSDAHFQQAHVSLGGDQKLPVGMLGIQTLVSAERGVSGSCPLILWPWPHGRDSVTEASSARRRGAKTEVLMISSP